MVGKDDLMNAVALNSSIFHAARIVGPALGGLVIAAVGEGWCFFLNGVSFLAVLAALLQMQLTTSPPSQTSTSALRNLIEGFHFVARPSPVRSLLLLLGLVSLAGTPYSVLLPLFARRILHVDARGLGLLMGAAGAGAVLGALLLSTRSNLAGLMRTVGRSAALAGASLLVFSQSKVFWLSSMALVPVGFGITTQLAATNTLLQSSVPDGLRGRVMAVYAMMFMGMMPLGALLAGAVTDRFGAPATVGAGGIVCLLGGGLFALRSDQEFRQDSADTTTPAAPTHPPAQGS
jgi:predicted MFS family arabinose efflux permease